MKNNNSRILIFLILYNPFTIAAQSWVLERNENDIKVYTSEYSGSDYKQFKAEITVKSTLAGIVKIINDFKSYPKWMYDCTEAYSLKKVNKTEGYVYSVVKCPWPLDDRDIVTHYKLIQDSTTKEILIILLGDKDFIPETDNVRVESLFGFWKIAPLKSGFVKISYQLHLEPGGFVPSVIANAYVTESPYNTLLNFKKLIDIKENYTYKLVDILEPS